MRVSSRRKKPRFVGFSAKWRLVTRLLSLGPIGSTKKLTEKILSCFWVFLSRVLWFNAVGIHPPTLRSIDWSINPIFTAKYFCVSLSWSAVHGSAVSAM